MVENLQFTKPVEWQDIAVPSEARPLHSWATSCCTVITDFVALAAIYWVVVIARYLVSPEYKLGFYLHLFPGIVLFLVAFALQGLYPGILMHPVEEIRRVFYGITTVFLLIGSVTFVTRDAESYSRSVFLVAWTCGVPGILLARGLVRRVLSRYPWWGVPTLVLGSGEAAQRVATALSKKPSLGLRVVGLLGSRLQSDGLFDQFGVQGSLQMAPLFASRGIASYAIVAMPELSHRELAHVIQNYCRGFRHILLMPDFVYACSLGVSARDVGGELGIEVPQRLFHWTASIVKRVVDGLGSALGLLALAPVFLFISLMVRLTSRGPVFYSHERHGLGGGVFPALKFRTMVVNGNEVLEAYFREHPDQLIEWNREHKLKDDPRITSAGKWLRRYSLDELPQLLNVLKGDMSLVGPRPIVPNELDKYADSFEFCTSVRPGLTGLWQVSGRNHLSFPDRVRFNEYYIRNWSIWLDLYILFKTVKVVLVGEGAY